MNRMTKVSFLALMAQSCAAYAIDIQPTDYRPLPAGMSAILLYGQHIKADSLDVDHIGNIPGSSLKLAAGALRAVHYADLPNGMRYAINGYVTFGSFRTARAGGADQAVRNGVGDLVLGATVYPHISDDGDGRSFALGLTTLLTVPVGKAHPGEVSVSSNAWQITPQVGIEWGMGNGWYVDGAADVSFSFDHDIGPVEYSRDPSVHIQAMLRRQLSPTMSVTAGYSGKFGGKLDADGIYTGEKTRQDQLRLFFNTSLDATTQLQTMVARDVHVEGGFKRDSEIHFRLAKAF